MSRQKKSSCTEKRELNDLRCAYFPLVFFIPFNIANIFPLAFEGGQVSQQLVQVPFLGYLTA